MTDGTESAGRRGSVGFVLLHHGGCPRARGPDDGAFHFRINHDGTVVRLRDESERGQHVRSIGIVIDGDFDDRPPREAQRAALEGLLLELKMRYPAAELGAHRQVRGDADTTCPGRRFPMKDLRAWFRTELPQRRDEALNRSVESQYQPN